MTKLFILLAVTLILQGSHQASLPSYRLNNLEEALEDLAQSLRHADEIIKYVGNYLSSVTRDYEHQINDNIEQQNFISLLNDLQHTIFKIEDEASKDSKSCVQAALRNTMVIASELKREIDSCVADAHKIRSEIQSNLETIDGKAIRIEEELIEVFPQCLSDGVISEKTTECVRNLVDSVNGKLVALDQQVKDTHELVDGKAEDGIKNLDMCFQKVKQDFNLKSETILEVLSSCVQKGSGFFSQHSPKGIMDIIRELKDKIDSILHMLSHLPTSISEIQDKINEIISHINISLLISKMKDEINDIIKDGGSNSESCRPMADEGIDAIVKNSEESTTKCLGEAESSVGEIQDSIAALSSEAKQILEDITSQTNQCFQENKLNPIEFYKCLERHVDGFQQRVDDLQQRVTDIYDTAVDVADEIIKSLAQCINQEQMNTIKQGQALIKDVETCVRHSHPIPLYFMK